MQNVTTKQRELAPALMARVDSCAYISMADRPEKITAIMEGRGVEALEAGRIYVIGALKAAIRRGTARNYREALDNFEAEQVGDRGNPLTRTISANNTARKIAEYSHMNNKAPMRINTVDVVRMAWAHMDNQPYTAYAQPQNWHIADTQPEAEKRTHTPNMGKVLGTLYTEWEAREAESDPAYESKRQAIDTKYLTIEKNLTVFFTEYTGRLSKTVKMRLAELKAYLDSKHDVEQAIGDLLSAKGYKAPETSKLAVFIDHLHRNFTHKDAVTCRKFVSLLYKYGLIS
jgi:hypothetical protein